MGLHDFTVYDLIRRNAANFRNNIAWFEANDDRTLTFGELGADVDRLACGLQKAGIEKGDRIGVMGKNSLEYFLIYGAAAALGAIVLPINWRLSAEEAAFNLNDCQPKLLFADEEFQDLVDGIKGRLPSVNVFYNLEPGKGRYTDFKSLTDNNKEFDPADVTSVDGFVIIHTAAVAGRPRGALISHANVLCADMHFNYYLKIAKNCVHLNMLPMFHVGGLFMVMTVFHAGAQSVNMPKFDAEQAVRLITDKNVSLMFDFAPILTSILDQSEKSNGNISTLKTVIGLESPETIERYQKKTGGTFYCMYGQTETSCLATICRHNDKPGSAGKVIQLADIRLVDDHDKPVPAGSVGEITMKGPMVFKGYWNLPDDNAHTFRDGWHHTGDLGRFDEDGFLFYAGRKAEKELIKPGGENVYPAEVEKAVLLHPAVEKTVVIGVPDPKWKEGIKAVCQLKPGMILDAKDLIAFVGNHIARYKKPQYVEFVDEIPIRQDGSPDRAKVKELYGGGQN